MASKRRLSKGNGLIGGIPFAEDDEEEEMNELANFDEAPAVPNRRQSSGFRRGSILGSMMSGAKSPPLNPIEQARIAEMYKTVIQLSTDNKLTEKNSWNYDLIDHMGKLIKDEAVQGVNFQKASCTLDASVKIYSNRVDDTYATSHRILESLSRNANERDADDDDDAEAAADAEESGEPRKPKGRVGSKAASNKLGVAKTIERNVTALNMVKLEHDYGVDPMFQKMAKAFDEGGAKGMIMYNMRVPREGAYLSFDCSKLESEPTSSAPADSEAAAIAAAPISDSVDISDLISKAGFTLTELAKLELCPPLDDYRATIGFPENTTGVLERLVLLPALAPSTDNDVIITSTATAEQQQQEQELAVYESYGDCYDDGDNDYCPTSDEPATSAEDTSRRESTGSSSAASRSSLGVGSGGGGAPARAKLQWTDCMASNDSVGGIASAPLTESYQQITEGLENLQLLSESNVNPYASDYTVFDVDAIVNSNSWAGARHWKYATRRRDAAALKQQMQPQQGESESADGNPAAAEEEGEDTLSGVAGKKRKAAAASKKGGKAAKEAVMVDFTLDLVTPAELDLPTSSKKRDTTLMTEAALEKAAAEAESLLLPSDNKMQLKDLCRLFLTPSIIVPPPQFHSAIQSSLQQQQQQQRSTSSNVFASSNILRNMFPEEAVDILWGQPTQAHHHKRLISVPAGESANAADFSEGSEGAAAALGDDYDDAGGCFDSGDYDDDNAYGGDCTSFGAYSAAAVAAGGVESTAAASVGLEIDKGKLVQATRMVEKIEIGYATVSKRVNIQRLKTDIWSNVTTHLPVDEEDEHSRSAKKAAASVGSSDELSFQQMIGEIAGNNPRQKDVTLPFYFICLLHLANEHGLKIEDREDLSDLIITKGMK